MIFIKSENKPYAGREERLQKSRSQDCALSEYNHFLTTSKKIKSKKENLKNYTFIKSEPLQYAAARFFIGAARKRPVFVARSRRQIVKD